MHAVAASHTLTPRGGAVTASTRDAHLAVVLEGDGAST